MNTNLNEPNYFMPKEYHSNILFSSKNLTKKAYHSNYNDATSYKKDAQRKKFTEEDYPLLPTQKKLNFTPFHKEEAHYRDIPDNFESKQTLNNFSFNMMKEFQQRAGINFNYFASNESNKENSGLQSNSRSMLSMLNSGFSSEIIRDQFSSESGFKVPAKKSMIPEDQDKKNHFNQIKKNLQLSFANKESNILFEGYNRQYKTTTIISSSSSSSTSQVDLKGDFNSESGVSKVSPVDQSVINNCCNSEMNNVTKRNPFIPQEISDSQKTITESLLENFNNKSILIPREKCNDEKYKLLAIKKIRKHTFKNNKSTSHNDLAGEPNTMMDCALYTDKRKKLAHSVKKVYASELLLSDPSDPFKRKQSFKIFQDADIGFNSHWQQYLKNSHGDEDVPSDEDQIKRAEAHNAKEFEQAILEIFVSKRTDLIQNLEMRKHG